MRRLDFIKNESVKDLSFAPVLSVPDAPGSFAWASPEQLLGERCSFSSDIWSLGVTLWVRRGCCMQWLLPVV